MARLSTPVPRCQVTLKYILMVSKASTSRTMGRSFPRRVISFRTTASVAFTRNLVRDSYTIFDQFDGLIVNGQRLSLVVNDVQGERVLNLILPLVSLMFGEQAEGRIPAGVSAGSTRRGDQKLHFPDGATVCPIAFARGWWSDDRSSSDVVSRSGQGNN